MRSQPIPDTGLAVEVPDDWESIDDAPMGCALAVCESEPDGGFATNLTVMITRADSDPDDQVAALRAGLEGFQLLDRTEAGGGWRLWFAHADGSHELSALQHHQPLRDGTGTAVLTITAATDRLDDTADEMAAIADSLGPA